MIDLKAWGTTRLEDEVRFEGPLAVRASAELNRRSRPAEPVAWDGSEPCTASGCRSGLVREWDPERRITTSAPCGACGGTGRRSSRVFPAVARSDGNPGRTSSSLWSDRPPLLEIPSSCSGADGSGLGLPHPEIPAQERACQQTPQVAASPIRQRYSDDSLITVALDAFQNCNPIAVLLQVIGLGLWLYALLLPAVIW